MARTRINKGRKRRLSRSTLERRLRLVERRYRSAIKRLDEWQARWDAKCPEGHLRRYDHCTLYCDITVIDALPTLEFTTVKMPAKGVVHEWVTDTLQPIADQRGGWWWRVPYGWWLKFWRWAWA